MERTRREIRSVRLLTRKEREGQTGQASALDNNRAIAPDDDFPDMLGASRSPSTSSHPTAPIRCSARTARYRLAEATACRCGLNPDQPPHPMKVTRTV
jgi:hypothetical protein